MQLDWISAFTETPPSLWPGYTSGERWHIDPHGVVVRQSPAFHLVEDPDADLPSSSPKLSVWTPSPGSLYLSGNPVKLLQGHNLWGSMDAFGLFLEAGLFVRHHAGLFPGASTWSACQFSRPRYTRLDITRSYRFPVPSMAPEYIRHVAGSARSRHGAATLYGSGTAYFGQHSKRWTMKIYDKHQEFLDQIFKRAKALLTFDHAFMSLLEWSKGVVRFELTLRAKELAKHSQWLDIHNPDHLDKLWHMYFSTIQFNENAAMKNQASISLLSPDISRPLRRTYRDWLAGYDLRHDLPQNTFYRHRRALLAALGVDIASPPPAVDTSSAPSADLDPAGWDPEPLPGGLVEPRPEIKSAYPIQ